MDLLEPQDSGAEPDTRDGDGPPIAKAQEAPVASLEQHLTELEEIVSSLESSELGLEQMLETFERGLKISSTCRAQLDRVEQKIRQLVEDQTELTEVEARDYAPQE